MRPRVLRPRQLHSTRFLRGGVICSQSFAIEPATLPTRRWSDVERSTLAQRMSVRISILVSPCSPRVSSTQPWRRCRRNLLTEGATRDSRLYITRWGGTLTRMRRSRDFRSNTQLIGRTGSPRSTPTAATQMLHSFGRAYDQKDVDLLWFKGNLAFKALETDPRYRVFLRKMNLPE